MPWFVCVVDGCEKPQTGVPVGLPAARQGSLAECFAALRTVQAVVRRIKEFVEQAPLGCESSSGGTCNFWRCATEYRITVENVFLSMCDVRIPTKVNCGLYILKHFNSHVLLHLDNIISILCGTRSSEGIMAVVECYVKKAEIALEKVKNIDLLARDAIMHHVRGDVSCDPAPVISVIKFYSEFVHALINLIAAACAQFPFEGSQALISRALAAARAIDERLGAIQELNQLAGGPA